MAQTKKVNKKHVTLALVLVSVLGVAFIASFYLQVMLRADFSADTQQTDFFFG